MRLDRADSYLQTFTATVTTVEARPDGTWVTLDRSAFYPTAGGQPHDTGTLGGHAVIDVRAEDGRVWHRLADHGSRNAVAAVGDEVVGTIDWERRFTHMQRHTGQHLLSQAFLRVGRALGKDFGTKSVSLRGAACTLDLDGDKESGLDADACARAAHEANEAARRAMPVTAFEVPDSDLGEYQLRRPSKVSGLVRLVAIGDYDLVACGGTHVQNSAELLPVAVLGSERVRGGLTRVTFKVGQEAVADAVVKHDVVARLGTALSSTVEDLPSHIVRLHDELGSVRASLASALANVAGHVASAAVKGATPVAGAALVRVVLRERETPMFEALIDDLQSREGVVGMCAVLEPDRVRLAFVAGPGVTIDVRRALTSALAIIGGRGGGRPDRAMGAGADATRLEEALDVAAAVIQEAAAP